MQGDTTINNYNHSFYYGRKYTGDSVPAFDSDWTYFFMIDHEGNAHFNGRIYENGISLSDKYADISGVEGEYLPRSGGVITGNLTVQGTLTAVASTATQVSHSLSINGRTFDGHEDINVGTIGVAYGGTGKTSWTANRLIYASSTSALSELVAGTAGQLLQSNGNSAPSWINQNTIAAGSATRDSDGNAINTTYRKLNNNDFTTASVDDLTVEDITVTGTATFSDGLSGDIVGNVTGNVTGNVSGSAGSVVNSLTIQLNGGTTEGTNRFTYNGSAAKSINITRTSIGLGAAADKNVDSTITIGSESQNLPTAKAVASFVESKGYVTSSGVTSVRVQATGPVVSSQSTAQDKTLDTTISLANGYGDTKNPYGNKNAGYVLAGPASGNAAAPTFRRLTADDIPSLTTAKISNFPTTWALANVSGATNLQAIEGLASGTAGVLKKNGQNNWGFITLV